jgi:hypothetical protein
VDRRIPDRRGVTSSLQFLNGTASSAVSTGADARTALRNYMLTDAALAAARADVQQATIDMFDLRRPADAIKSGCVSVLASLAKQ